MLNEGSFHSYALSVTGFLGGITFASMILLMQIQDQFEYGEWLITGTAIVSVFFIISTVGMVHIASNQKEAGKKFTYLMQNMANFGFFGLMALLPFILFPFSHGGAIILAVIETIVIVLFVSKKGK